MIYIRPDLYGHWGWGIFIGLSGHWIGYVALALAAAIASLKELYDSMHPPHKSEWADFIATMIGAAMSLGVIELHRVWP